MSEYDVLFTPFKIGQLEIRNRIVMCPMGTNAAYSDGTISENKIDYYARRSQGGVGMIIEGCQFISQELASGCIEGALEEKYSVPRQSVLVEPYIVTERRSAHSSAVALAATPSRVVSAPP